MPRRSRFPLLRTGARDSGQAMRACPFSARQPDYLPFLDAKEGPFKMTMGIQPLKWADWIEIDEWYEEEITLKRQLLLQNRDRVLQTHPQALHAAHETLQQLCAWLPRFYPDRFAYERGCIYNRATGDCFDTNDPAIDPLFAASLLVQEDLILMHKGRLIAGGLCFPMRWSLMKNMGNDIPGLHAPVPGFQESLAGHVSTFLEKVKPERPFWRANWGVDANPNLPQFPLENAKDIEEAEQHAIRRGSITPENAGEKLFLRVERQTFSRLPESQALLFTIHTFVRPLKEVVTKRPEVARKLCVSVCQLPHDFAEYKTLAGFKDVLVEYLQNAAASPLKA